MYCFFCNCFHPFTYLSEGKIIDFICGRYLKLPPSPNNTEKRDYKGSVIWHCRCDCGNEVDVSADGILTGNNVSCGCLKREHQENLPNLLHHVDGTCVEWLEKRKHRSDNTSGHSGVFRMKNGKYRVTIGFKGTRYYLGVYGDYDEAVRIRQSAEAEIHDAFVSKYHKWEKRSAEDPEWGKENPFVFRVIKLPRQSFRVESSPEMEEETVKGEKK